ncbi:serine/threonine-protein kinase [Roseibacillus persicicus]|nr:serine/threonine-protein kinase [Roseibacillus persicicus]MDQ8192200.1 serine/threonine-protein kinase [Roseibacillus persicicus]
MMKAVEDQDDFQNDYRLIQAYQEATQLEGDGLAGLCPSYLELSEIETRYEEQTLLGKGGVKAVYRTFDNRTRRWVAMARLKDGRGPEYYDLFVNEAWLTSSLNHPNIINVHDVGIDSSGRPFFTMDLKGNTTLGDLIAAQNRSRRSLLQDFMKVCDAMAYAHSRDIIHLDLKPDNIQSDDYGEVLVCDWGLGKLVSQVEEELDGISSTEAWDNMTLLGEIKGSPGYMAPEQVKSGGVKDHRTDIFSLGCILHAILTGEAPFTGDNHSMLSATTDAEIADPCEKYPSLKVPPSLGAVTLKALAKNPDDRYGSVSELKEEIQRYLDGFSTDAEAPNFLREARLFASRNRTPVLISFLSLIVLTVLSTLFIERVNELRQSVLNQSQLADQYASEAELANEKYFETLSKSKEQQLALSESLIFSTNRLKNRGIFDTPMKSIREAKELANHAYALNPDSNKAKYQIFALNIIQLNFAEALKEPLEKGSLRYPYVQLAESFPEFNYDRYRRPSLDELTEFLQEAGEIDLEQSPILERILSYDASLRGSKRAYERVVLQFVKYLNPGEEVIALEALRSRSAFRLCSAGAIRLIADPGGSEQCVLRYLIPRSLVLEMEEEFDLAQLQGLGITKLDLTMCPNVRLEESLSLPSLNSIKIDPNHHSAELLRKWLTSSVSFEIVAEPSHVLMQDQ